MYNNVSILIVGYDGYIDVWNHCISLMNTYWKERPMTYLATSVLNPQYENVKVIPTGENTEWSLRTKIALEQIKTPYVILLLEDFFISDYVNNDKVEEALQLVENNNILFYQLLVQLINSNWEKGKPFQGNKHIHIVPTEKKYGINLQAAIWKTDFLKEKIGDGNYNAWKFEVNQLGKEKYNIDKVEYLIDDRNILNITHAIVQSKYLRGAIKNLKNKNYVIDLSEREMLSYTENLKYELKLFMYSVTPKCLVEPAKKIGRFLKIDFVTDRIEKEIS